LRTGSNVRTVNNNDAIQVNLNFSASRSRGGRDTDGIIEIRIDAAQGCGLYSNSSAAGVNNIALYKNLLKMFRSVTLLKI